MESRVRELEEKLKKSEDQRQKLKDNLVRIWLCKPTRCIMHDCCLRCNDSLG